MRRLLLLLCCVAWPAHAQMHMLLNGHVDAIPQGWDPQLAWYAIVTEGSDYKAVRASPQLVEDPTNAINPYRVEGNDAAHFYVTGIEALADQQTIRSAGMFAEPYGLEPSNPYRTKWADGDVTLAAGATYAPNAENMQPFLQDYTLYVLYQQKRQALFHIDYFDDAVPVLHWAGDLNADGHPDFLIDQAHKYSYSEIALWSSVEADDGSVRYERACEWLAYSC